MTERHTEKLSELLEYNLQSVRASLLREDFQRFRGYRNPFWARRLLKECCIRTMRSKLKLMKKVARTPHSHEELIPNWS